MRNASWRNVISDYFNATTHPFNLAVFRIVFFSYLLHHLDYKMILWYSRMPADMLYPPMGTGWLLKFIPVNEVGAHYSYILFRVFCVASILGLFSRFSAFMTTLLAFYVLGIPQFFGFVTHYNHLIWFAAIMAVSRSGDYFSIDAIVAAWKRADRGDVEPPKAAAVYNLPFCFIWILIGIIYFFPGFWKLWLVGPDWVLGDALKLKMYQQWLNQPGWLPVFRLDEYPTLCRMAGAGTIIFELGFIFMMFFPRPRFLAAVFGLIFEGFPTYSEIVSGTPKLTLVLRVNNGKRTSKDQLVSLVVVRPSGSLPCKAF
jgi:hypothetical protein